MKDVCYLPCYHRVYIQGHADNLQIVSIIVIYSYTYKAHELQYGYLLNTMQYNFI